MKKAASCAMEDVQRIVKCGNLSLHSSGGLFKRWHNRYLVLYDGSKSGVRRLELFESEIKFKKQNPIKIIPLVDCVRVVTCQRGGHKSSYTFEVRTSDQIYLLAAQTFQDMNDWVNCLRLVAFGQSLPTGGSAEGGGPSSAADLPGGKSLASAHANKRAALQRPAASTGAHAAADVLLGVAPAPAKPPVPTDTHPVLGRPLVGQSQAPSAADRTAQSTTASQAAAAAASALARTRQRQPSLIGSCKPLPPTDSPFLCVQRMAPPVDGGGGAAGQPASTGPQQQQQQQQQPTQPLQQAPNGTRRQPDNGLGEIGDTLTPTLRSQLLVSAGSAGPQAAAPAPARPLHAALKVPETLDEGEENMLYCSIEDNPSEHTYRVKVIETELALRCQLKCYQLTAPTTVSQQYEQIGRHKPATDGPSLEGAPPVTFYQIIIGPQALTLLNDYASPAPPGAQAARLAVHQQQGLWSWPYQCIRRYGFDKDNCFVFEAGRKCTSGPGQFIVQTPKAYIIYQDVVKFVYELRNVAGADNGALAIGGPAAAAAALPPATSAAPQRIERPASAITQIPVTWTPVGAKSAAAAEGSMMQPQDAQQRQFFEALKRSEGGHTQAAHLPGSCRPDDIGRQLASAPSSQAVGPDTVAKSGQSGADSARPRPSAERTSSTSDETDESGYEHGDESAECSSVRSTKQHQQSHHSTTIGTTSSSSPGGRPQEASGARRRPATSASNESMSSSSSTSSGSGSLGHSTSRARNSSLQTNKPPTSKRPPLAPLSLSHAPQQAPNKATDQAPKRSAKDRLFSQQPLDEPRADDFEANLIRDVYSEITKLHAKFAVASGSADDSISSSSGSSSSIGHEGSSTDNSAQSGDDHRAVHAGQPKPMNAPIYSNVNHEELRAYSNQFTRSPAMGNPRFAASRLGAKKGAHSAMGTNHGQSSARGEPNTNEAPPVPRHLNQVVATSEPSPQQVTRKQQVERPRPNQQASTRLASPNDHDPVECPVNLQRCGPMFPSMLNPIPELSESAPNPPHQATRRPINQSHGDIHFPSVKLARANLERNSRNASRNDSGNQCSTQPLSRSKFPTKHYVINDVQYAKVSRNMFSRCNQGV